MNEGRWELKYMLRRERIPDLLALSSEHAHEDPHAGLMHDGTKGYIVSSLYLDTPDLTGYSERLRMDRIRNRVRVRTYGVRGDGAPVFLEAKRKLDNLVIKHRARAGDAETWATLGERPWQQAAKGLTGIDAVRARRFLAHVDGKGMNPVCTVRYHRRIWAAGTARLTIDSSIFAAASPPAWDLYVDCPVRLIPHEWVVVELKFYGQQPAWMRTVVRELRLNSEPVSKFAMGVANCLRTQHPGEIAQVTPHTVLEAAAA